MVTFVRIVNFANRWSISVDQARDWIRQWGTGVPYNQTPGAGGSPSGGPQQQPSQGSNTTNRYPGYVYPVFNTSGPGYVVNNASYTYVDDIPTQAVFPPGTVPAPKSSYYVQNGDLLVLGGFRTGAYDPPYKVPQTGQWYSISATSCVGIQSYVVSPLRLGVVRTPTHVVWSVNP
jgi:hypothetical protein